MDAPDTVTGSKSDPVMNKLTTRAAVAVFQLALVQLLESAGVDVDLADLVVNMNGRAHRIDIAKLTPDGQRLGEWLRGYSVDPYDLAKFGEPVPLPGMEGPTH